MRRQSPSTAQANSAPQAVLRTPTLANIHKVPVDVLHTVALHVRGGLEEVEQEHVQGVVNAQREALQVGWVQGRRRGGVEGAEGVHGHVAVCRLRQHDRLHNVMQTDVRKQANLLFVEQVWVGGV